jgi:hypothetical protein
MKMKNKFNILVLSVTLIVLASCNSEDFLDEKPFASLDQSTAFSGVSLVRAGVTGVYDLMSFATYYGRDYVIVSEVMADNVFLHPGNSGRFVSEYFHSTIDSDGDASGIFGRIYRVISNANGIIENLDNCTDCTQADIDDALGHAYATRALAHFDLMRLFAFPYNVTDASVAPGANGAGGNMGIPLRLSTGTELPARNTVSENFGSIISDLQTAQNRLSSSGLQLDSRFSKNAVKALLSRVYLYMEDYSNARAMADQVIGSGIYTLVSNANYAASWEGEGSSETILQLVYREDDNLATTGLSYIYIPEGYGDFPPTNELLNLYGANDVRNSWFQTDDFTYSYKLPGRGEPLQPGLNDVPLIRLSEVYLNKAEAEYHLGNTSAAQQALDVIAQRANPALANNASVGADLLNDILTERRKELAFEGHRLFDVNRNKLDINRSVNSSPDETELNTYPDCKMIYPIPFDETSPNPNIMQNECY